MNQNTIIEEAIRYTDIGFSVIPLGAITKDSSNKKLIGWPDGGWKKYQNSIATKEEIALWDYKNIGIVTGQVSGLLVLDIDSYKENFNKELFESLKLPHTPVQETASGGKQYFFKLPKDLIVKNAVCIGSKDSGIDIRSEGGMVICSPSKTTYGEYRWLVNPFDTPLADIPTNLYEIIKRDFGKKSKVKKTLPELINLSEGEGRNNATASFIGKLLLTVPKEKWDEEVLPMVVAVNNTHKTPLDKNELLGVYKSITKIESERRSRLDSNSNKEASVSIAEFIPSLTHAELILKDFPKARYTLEPFFEQGTMNMVSAPPNTWKSWLLFLFASHIATGSALFDKFTTEKANVMIVNEEDSPRLIQDRLKLLKMVDPSLSIFYRIAHGSKLKEDFVNSLILEAKDKNIGVIMFDSLRAIHEADENDSTAMQGIMDLLKKIARENITVIFTHHHRKKSMFGKNDDAESSRGSSAINASISGHISLEEVNKDEEKYLVVKHLKSKVGEKLPPFDIGIQTGEIVSFQYLGEHKPQEQALTEAKDKVLSAIENQVELMSRKDFVYLKIGGMTTIKNVIKSLVKEGRLKEITRKEAEKFSYKTFSQGKGNEKLYSLREENEVEVGDMPPNANYDNPSLLDDFLSEDP